MMENYDHLLPEISPLCPGCAGIRVNDGRIEFALHCSDGGIEWFSYHQLPWSAQNYLISLRKLGVL